MKRVLFIILLFQFSYSFCQPFTVAKGVRNGWNNVRTITIDHTKVPNTDQSSFPVLISGTYSYLATQANSGYVFNSSGYDISFFSDINCTTKLNFEIETWSATTGVIQAWVLISTLSHTTDNVIYIAYGNPTITSSQQNATAVWDANYKGVWHLPNGTSLTANDATSNANNGTLVGSPTAVAGQIDGAAAFNGSSQYITAPQISLTTGITVEAWVYRIGSTGAITAVSFGANSADGFGFWLSNGDNVLHFIKYSVADISSGIASTANTWEHIVWTVDSDLKPRLYKNGSLVYTSTNTQSIVSTTHGSSFGAVKDGSGTPSNYLQGNIDEIRLSNVVRSADWITTEYNNQNSPSTFYTIGSAF